MRKLLLGAWLVVLPSFGLTKLQMFGIGVTAGAAFHVPVVSAAKVTAKAIRHPKQAVCKTKRGLKKIKP